MLAAPAAAGVIERPGVAANVAGRVRRAVPGLERHLPRQRRARPRAGSPAPPQAQAPDRGGRTRAADGARDRGGLRGGGHRARHDDHAPASEPSPSATCCSPRATRCGGGGWWCCDILAIAAGFVVRALAGGVATDIYLSRWFVLVTGFCAIYLVAAKRLAELREQRGLRPCAEHAAPLLGAQPARRARRVRGGRRQPPTYPGPSRGRPTSPCTCSRSSRSCCGSSATRCWSAAGRRPGAGGAHPARSRPACAGRRVVRAVPRRRVCRSLSWRARRLQPWRERSLSGWGRTAPSRCEVHDARDASHAGALLAALELAARADRPRSGPQLRRRRPESRRRGARHDRLSTESSRSTRSGG